MTDAQLYEIEKRAYLLTPISIVLVDSHLAEWISAAGDDRRALLAEVSRLRAALAEARPIVEEVARIDEHGSRFDPRVPYDAQVSLLTITRARALLASEKVSDEND